MNLEKSYLWIVITVLLFLGVGNLWDHKLSHDFPYGYMASDTFQQQTRAEGIKDVGNYRHEPPYIVKGYTDVVGYYPPVLHHLGVLLSFSTGIPLYDTLYFMIFLSAIMAALVMYVIIRTLNKHIALLSLPLAVLLFSSKSYIGFLWGHWASIVGQLFLICIFWAVCRNELSKSWLLLGMFFAALGLSHTSELLYGAGFVTLFGIYLLFTKQFTKSFLFGILFAALLAGALVGYNLLIFVQSFQVVNPYSFSVSTDWGGTPIFYLTDFGLLLIVLAAGLIGGMLFFRKMHLLVIAGVFMLLVGYTNYIGFGIRAFQPRLLWPVYFMFFFGMGLYLLLNLIPQYFRSPSMIGVGILFLFLFANAFSPLFSLKHIPTYNKVVGPGIMDPWHWEALQWIGKNTAPDAKVYFFYGDPYSQDAILRNAKRTHAQIIPEDFVADLQNRSIHRVFETETPADHGAGMPYFSPFPKIKLHQRSDLSDFMWKGSYDICLFDYFVLDKASRQEALAQYNLLIANDLIENGGQVAFQNDMVVILTNTKVGGECIAEKTF